MRDTLTTVERFWQEALSEVTEGSKVLSLALKNSNTELLRLSEEVDAFADRHALADDTRFGLQLCLEEAVMNVVNYGFDDLDEHDILIDLSLQDDDRSLRLAIVDDGVDLGYLDERGSFLEDQTLGGLGFLLMRQYSDDLSYERRDGRNHLLLVKKIS